MPSDKPVFDIGSQAPERSDSESPSSRSIGSGTPAPVRKGLSKFKNSFLSRKNSSQIKSPSDYKSSAHEQRVNHTTDSMAHVPGNNSPLQTPQKSPPRQKHTAPATPIPVSASRHHKPHHSGLKNLLEKAMHPGHKSNANSPTSESPSKGFGSFINNHILHKNTSSHPSSPVNGKSSDIHKSQSYQHLKNSPPNSRTARKPVPRRANSASHNLGSTKSPNGNAKESLSRSAELPSKAKPMEINNGYRKKPSPLSPNSSIRNREGGNGSYFDGPLTASPTPSSPTGTPNSMSKSPSLSSLASTGASYRPGPSKPLVSRVRDNYANTSYESWPHSTEFDMFTYAVSGSLKLTPQGTGFDCINPANPFSPGYSGKSSMKSDDNVGSSANTAPNSPTSANSSEGNQGNGPTTYPIKPPTNISEIPRKLKSGFIPPYAKRVVPRLSAKYKLVDETKDMGSGATAVIRIVTLKNPKENEKNLRFAVKAYRRKADDETDGQYIAKLASEWLVQCRMEHPNVVKSYDLCIDSHIFPLYSDTWCAVMDFCPRGDLLSLIEDRHDRLGKKDFECMIKQILRGLNYIHSQGIAHRDIKPENILISEYGVLRITDFGACDVLCNPGDDITAVESKSMGIFGSDPYMAPEILTPGSYNAFFADMWSTAIVLHCLYFRTYPFRKASQNDQLYAKYCKAWREYNLICDVQNIRISKTLPYFKPVNDLPMHMQRLFFCLANPTAEQRITAQEALNLPFVQEIECCSVDDCTCTHDAPEECLEWANPPVQKLSTPHNHL
ncbi:serine/threonine protein kinase Nnk1 [Schizosaccharomyces pombe]|uniref:Probable serine/threonine-protein kinase C70.05c n=1 Tax=Schizosaccharomyces pombe (strain 972 / ATCC 24843) TaxID=284812 RepID=KJ45_SCHPO|nr:putative serine/threonine protein kinase [Schizosaccharomyces pombe]O74526.1 RecName: Full=Probable serine/threonine-protein kinase C70.05c [Schizosaccharomyces pombe 972h-]CAA19355.1 serine/threonine protein kinase (predicted) [Schizosaccharomyces pombe]|eukprot:NP_588539.1 putative serine/threonine protein kinase [Schizosaccharomyces pombe]